MRCVVCKCPNWRRELVLSWFNYCYPSGSYIKRESNICFSRTEISSSHPGQRAACMEQQVTLHRPTQASPNNQFARLRMVTAAAAAVVVVVVLLVKFVGLSADDRMIYEAQFRQYRLTMHFVTDTHKISRYFRRNQLDFSQVATCQTTLLENRTYEIWQIYSRQYYYLIKITHIDSACRLVKL